MELRRVLAALLVSGALSIGVWLALREPIGRAVRGVTAAALQASGHRAAYPRDLRGRGDEDLRDDGDEIGIVIAAEAEPGRRRLRSYGISLMRWHVNLIVLPVLVMSLGTATLRQRLLMMALGIPALVALDGCNAFLFLLLGARRMRGDELISPAFHGGLEHGLAVYVTKIIPLVVWGLLYVIVRRSGRGPRDAPAG
jgi:hypothetical protein